MSRVNKSWTKGAARSEPENPPAKTSSRAEATRLSLPIGPLTTRILDWGYRTRRPVLLEGATGIGKSELVADFARARGMECVVLDLSLFEPPDLVGLPVIRGDRTHYAAPAELPTEGRGVLMLEELNRAEIPVMQPALQLLSARRLHSYTLPPGWMCVAAINPEDGEYQVNTLDPALRSRFLQLHVHADPEAWLTWAAQHDVHPLVTELVREHPDALEQVSPRSWTYASSLLQALEPEDLAETDAVHAALRGYMPTAWALLLAKALGGYAKTPTLSAATLFGDDGATHVTRLVTELLAAKRPDAVVLLAAKIRAGIFQRIDTIGLAEAEALVAALPGDVRERILRAAAEEAPLAWANGLDLDGVLRTPLTLSRWVDEGRAHHVRLAVRALLGRQSASPDSHQALRGVVEAIGPFASDLRHWLDAS